MNNFLLRLPAEEQSAIAQETERLITEEMTLRQLRKARKHSQELVSEILHVSQAAVAKLERRTDMYVSTLRSFIRAMGGELEIVARFPDQPRCGSTSLRNWPPNPRCAVVPRMGKERE
ncbi:MAG: XRE family transcriptional regulator [Caldilineaceae bacterium]